MRVKYVILMIIILDLEQSLVSLFEVEYYNQLMSHLKIPRKQSHSPRAKMHSEESKPPKYSVQRIVYESVGKRRFSTQNSSLNKLESSQNKEMYRRKGHHHPEPLDPAVKLEIQQAKNAFKTKNTKKALPLFQKIYEHYPSIPDLPYFIGSCLLNETKFDLALTYFSKALDLDPAYDRNIYIYMAVCAKALGKIKEAKRILNEALQKYPRFEEAHFYKAKMHLKSNQLNEAIINLKKSVAINPQNQLALIILGDCLRKTGNKEEGMEKYNKAIKLAGDHTKTAYLHKMNFLIQNDSYKQLKEMLTEINKSSCLFQESSYFQGIIQYHNKNHSQAIILFEIALKEISTQNYTRSIIKYLMQIAILQKDCFGAEHLITRSKQLKCQDEELGMYYGLIEGINDLIKRKNSEAHNKLSQVYIGARKIKSQFLSENVLQYYGFCLFQMDQITKAIQVYQEYLSISTATKSIQEYNLKLCEGIAEHKKKKYEIAYIKFNEASSIMPSRVQPIFFKAINQIQKFKKFKDNQEIRQVTFSKIEKLFQQASTLMPKYSLFLFYESLVKLYQNTDACETINAAIQSADEEVSEYFFIDALAHAIKGEILSGLDSMNKAIEIDQNIPEFFKQRSKYCYALERYEQSVEDILKVLAENEDDQEAKLLLTFYYYLTDQTLLSLHLLKELVTQESLNNSLGQEQNKFEQFQQALNFRLENYQGCGIVGTLLNHIVNQKTVDSATMEEYLERINKRGSYSEFNTYFMYMVLSSYYLYTCVQSSEKNDTQSNIRFETAIDCLFGAMQEINLLSEAEDKSRDFSPIIESMLIQVKFNIVIANLLRISYRKDSKQRQDLYNETLKFINIFISETENLEFISIMKETIDFMGNENQCMHLTIYPQTKKANENFPNLRIQLGPHKIINTKVLLFYPQKLKFNINPEFDQSFLFNFDIDKIQSKLFPPWYKVHTDKAIVFTDNIRNQSVLLSETQRSITPLLRAPTPIQMTLKEKFKLDQSVQRRLNKLMKKQ